CGRVSTNPSAITYRGPAPFSAPETRVMRDFVNSRVRDGRQQIRTHITFHTAGRLVMWPYGYTLTDVPGDMTVEDQRTFVAMGRYMAASNGYKPEQASDLYLTSGTFRDWLYGRHRVFSFTFELTAGDYPADETIGPETGRNRRAALYLIDLANCPQRAIGKALDYCGPFFDDFEIGRGWTRDPAGADTATTGAWTIGDPQPTWTNGPKQLGTTFSGSLALVTGRIAGDRASANDVDGGVTTARSPRIRLPASGTNAVRFRYYLAHDERSTSADYLRLRIIGPASSTVLFQEVGAANDDDGAWATATMTVPAAYAGQIVQLQFEAADTGQDSLVEAGIDDVAVIRR
ncbi:MAG: zinc carboxypeptidase, partial [Actinomycetota bacterium]|nr:zinc carboxypeptidase [Actinomycetota bacterium]